MDISIDARLHREMCNHDHVYVLVFTWLHGVMEIDPICGKSIIDYKAGLKSKYRLYIFFVCVQIRCNMYVLVECKILAQIQTQFAVLLTLF